MHTASILFMRDLLQRVPGLLAKTKYDVLDVGACDINGTYRDLFQEQNYVGLDVVPGKNVDVVVCQPYCWNEIASASFDVVVSGQCLEHVEYPWLTMTEMYRVVRSGGLCLIIVPSAGREHRFPVDCYRYFPDGLNALAKWAGFEVVYCTLRRSKPWNDVGMICRKPQLNSEACGKA